MHVIKSSAGAYPPLDAAVGGVVALIELYDVCPMTICTSGSFLMDSVAKNTQDNRELMQGTMKRMDGLFEVLASRLRELGVDKGGRERARSEDIQKYMESVMLAVSVTVALADYSCRIRRKLQILLDDIKVQYDRHWIVRAVMSAEDKDKLQSTCESISQAVQDLQVRALALVKVGCGY